jgi:hypothetical protein
MDTLRQAELIPGIVPAVSRLKALTREIWHDGPIPVCMARYRVALPTSDAVALVRHAAEVGGGIPEPLPLVEALLETREVFVTGIPMHDQWALATPVVRSRLLVWSFDQRFWCTEPGSELPDSIVFDAGDGLGPRSVEFGQKLATTHPHGDTCTYTISARWGDEVLSARGIVHIGGSAAPRPDETWRLQSTNGLSGKAYVYHPHTAKSQAEKLSKPVIFSEGFPGGWACDYIYEMANQYNLLQRLLAAGHSVVLVGYNNGAIHIPMNSGIIISCLNQINTRTSDPVCIGGVSMGGQVTRYALAWLEWCGMQHSCQLYFSIDTPHLGSTTAVEVQWFVRAFAHLLPSCADLTAAINTVANREFLIAYLESDGVHPDPASAALFADFEAVGNFPKQPRCIAVASGHGKGGRSMKPGDTILTWTDHPFAEATLRVSGDGIDPTVACGGSYPPSSMPKVEAYRNAEGWEAAPGGQAHYAATAAAIAKGAACGNVTLHHPKACIVPTVSALYLKQDPFSSIPADPPDNSPFKAWAVAEENLSHCELSASTAEFLFREITSQLPN